MKNHRKEKKEIDMECRKVQREISDDVQVLDMYAKFSHMTWKEFVERRDKITDQNIKYYSTLRDKH